MNEMILYSCDAMPAMVEPKRRTANYNLIAPSGMTIELVRDVDFGMIRKKNGDAMSKTPTLFKSGAEKVAVAYGLCQRYAIESKIENAEIGLFFYTVRCDLVKIVNGQEYVITSAFGSGNTREGRTGNQSPYDGANSALKMAQKRALVSAALSLGCLSASFTQDLESELDGNPYINEKDPEKPITASQVKFFYSAASRNGLSKDEAKTLLVQYGYKSAKEIKTADFDSIIDAMKKED